MKRFMMLSAVCLVVSSCGLDSENGSKKTTLTRKYISGIPIKMKKADKKCSANDLSTQSEEFYLSLFYGGQSNIENYKMSHLLKKGYFKKKDKSLATTETLYEGKYKCEYEVSCKSKEPKTLNVCKSSNVYDRYTFERAGLGINFAIDNSLKELRKIRPNDKIEKLKIITAPFIEVYVDEKVSSKKKERHIQYYTDNAFYSYSKMDGPKITFLPQSDKAIDYNLFGGIPLWDIPMVGSHEYGHHIFGQYAKKYMNDEKSLHKKSSFCFDNRVEKMSLFNDASLRDVGTSEIFLAFNEGFADLFAFYTLGEKLNSMEKLHCFVENRDLKSNLLGNGRPKKLTDDVIETYIYSTEEEEASDCTEPSLQDSHIIGAIFAYGIDQLFSIKTNESNKKLSMLIKWLEQVDKQYYQIEAEWYKPDRLKKIYDIAIQVFLDEFNLTIDAPEVQKVLKEVYPNSELN